MKKNYTPSFIGICENHKFHLSKILVVSVLLILFTTNSLKAQNEFYIKGSQLKIEEGSFIHIEGDFHLDNNGSSAADKGQLLNDGLIQVRGNFVFESDNVEQVTDNASSEGIVRFKNYDASWHANATLENKAQRIIIESNASAEGLAAFNTLEIENEDRNVIGTSGNYVDITYSGTGVAIIEVKDQLIFNNASRFVTEDASTGSKTDGSDYACELYISNTASDAISFNGYYNLNLVDYRAQAGAMTRYVEGVLSRAVTGTNDYYFPVGLTPNYINNDGMEAFLLEVEGANGQKITAYINGNDVSSLNETDVYADVGENPGTGLDADFSDCIGAPDGVYDKIELNQSSTHEWQIDNESATDFDYNVEFFPGTGLNGTAINSTNVYSCGTNNFVIRYISKDGALYDRNSGSILTTQQAPTPFNGSGLETGYLYHPPTSISDGNRLNSLSSFSTFRIHSAINGATVLPVELLYLDAKPINNTFIELTWATASEINNDYFDIQRSEDGIEWENIKRVDGNGNTNETQYYKFEDYNIQAGKTYYYRLNQVDFDGTNTYSNMVHAAISSSNTDFSIGEVFPNPVQQGGTIQLSVTSPIQQNFQYEIINMKGQSVSKNKFFSIPPGVNRYVTLSVNTLPVGSYIISLWNEKTIYQRKLVVIK